MSTLKVTAIPFVKPAVNEVIRQFEGLYVYGVLSQLARLAEIHYKDFATLPKFLTQYPILKQLMSANLPADQRLIGLQQVSQSARTAYVLTGTINKIEQPQSSLAIQFELYHLYTHSYLIQKSLIVPIDAPEKEQGNTSAFSFTVEALNQSIQQTTVAILQAILGETQSYQAPLSTSLEALQYMLHAHQIRVVDEKIKLYKAALEADPQLETAFFHLAKIYKAESHYEQCIRYYRDTLKVSHAGKRNKALYATEAGIASALLGHSDLALQWWLRAIEYDATYINPFFNIAHIQEDKENYPEAEKYLERAQKLAPDDSRTFFNLARIYSKMGIWDKALKQYEFQLRSEKDDPWCHSDIAMCYLNLGNIEQARFHLEKTLNLDPQGEAGQAAQLILSGFG